MYRSICSNRDRFGFYAEIQIILGTVYTVIAKWKVKAEENLEQMEKN